MRISKAVLLIVNFMFLAVGAFGQELQRLSAQFKNFDGTETRSNVAATGTSSVPGTGGTLVYQKVVNVPLLSGGAVVFVTLSAVGDAHFGESNFLSCNVDGPGGTGSSGSICAPTPTVTGIDLAPPGWVGMAHHFEYNTTYCSNGTCGLTVGDGGGGTGDEHDNDYYYTWCKRVNPGLHTINLRLGNKSGLPNNNVFFEKAFFYIDIGNPPFGVCTQSSIR
jgi:hypothetical protein